MWKCQNLLRHHVKDLLDLIKKPKVALTDACGKTGHHVPRPILNSFSVDLFVRL